MDLIQQPIDDFKKPHRRIWKIAGPAILANSSAPLVGLVDVWAIGHMPDVSNLAAVGLGGIIFTYLFWAFGFLRMGTTGLVAQANGRGAKEEVVFQAIRSVTLGLFFASMLLLFQLPIFDLAIVALSPPEGVLAITAGYFDIRIWAAPATLFIYSINGVLFGLGRTKEALYLQLILNLSNAALNLTFVVGFGMGVEGVALGTLIAEWLAAIYGFYMMVKFIGGAALLKQMRSTQLWKLVEYQNIMILNGYIFIRTLLLMTALAMVMRVAGQMGEVEMATSHVISQFSLLMALGLDGFAHASEALVGGAYGMKKRKVFIRWMWLTTFWAVMASFLYSLFFWGFGSDVVNILTDLESVRGQVDENMWVVIAMPVVAVWSYQFDGIFIGATVAKAMMVTMALSFAVYLYFIGPLSEQYGLAGLWGAVLIFLGARGVFQAIYMPSLLGKLPVDWD